jgi:hypothetical protein
MRTFNDAEAVWREALAGTTVAGMNRNADARGPSMGERMDYPVNEVVENRYRSESFQENAWPTHFWTSSCATQHFEQIVRLWRAPISIRMSETGARSSPSRRMTARGR